MSMQAKRGTFFKWEEQTPEYKPQEDRLFFSRRAASEEMAV